MPTLNIICFLEKNKIFLRFCLCIFESDTVKSDSPMQVFRKIIKYLKILCRLLVYFTVCSGDIKKKSLKMKSSENEQSTGHF